MFGWMIRSGSYGGLATSGLDRSAPQSKSSFWM